MVRNYLSGNKALTDSAEHASWGNSVAKGVFVRPKDSALETGKNDMLEYVDCLATIPSHTAFIQGKPASDIRVSDGEDNILFRPLVQTALADALGKLVPRGVSLKNAVEELRRQEKLGQMKLTPQSSPWFGVLSDPSSGKMRRHKRNELLCSRLFQYLLGGGIEDDFDRETLRKDFSAQRQIDQERGLAIDLKGETVPTCKVRLPNPWR